MNTIARMVVVASVLLCAGLASAAAQSSFPPAEAGAVERLMKSPRHGEWVVIDAGNGDACAIPVEVAGR
jgi:hypothetical protein